MINTHFGKLVNGIITYAESPLLIGEEFVWTNDEKIYSEQGYLPVIDTEMPVKEGFFYVESYQEHEGKLVKVWEEHELPKVPKNIPVGEKVVQLEAQNNALMEQLAETEEAAIELYEASLMQEAINIEQDNAIIEIYEAMEVMING